MQAGAAGPDGGGATEGRPLPPPPQARAGLQTGWTGASRRIALLDLGRGLAVLAMVVYHFTWDLGFFGFISLQAGIDPGWRIFAKLIAGSFLFFVGVGLVLAHGEGIRWPAFWRRFAILALAAAAISLATWYATPESFIFFGILHCIALSSLLALPFLRLPVWAVLVAAVAALALPQVPAAHLPLFQHPAWLWLGLTRELPLTNDYEPILPWLGPVLLGIAAMRLLRATGQEARLASVRPGDPVSRGLAFVGRRSLPVYLVHQPLLFGGLALLAMALGPAPGQPGASGVGFETSCRRSCVAAGSGADFCEATCGCVASRLQGSPVLRDDTAPISPQERERIDAAVKACLPTSPGGTETTPEDPPGGDLPAPAPLPKP